ncbi:flagellar basal body-associated FliL family protein [Methylophaga sulfidovorans]|uniref:Flagellar protein FliL n=1 Tax=Methylophaga sulfidovorans TaxID=45496 RepID=A0A1I3XJS3_9GAMM|nr:flagellar basal body-associated FliL family protein [Methylophaga sulfidovorans]SFK19599.1 flagellar FliL protein [Methylophaga sulfidovorans]
MKKSLSLITVLLMYLLVTPIYAADESEKTPPVYYKIEEPFTINFVNQSQKRARYLQIKVALMTTSQEAMDSAVLNLPMIQDELRTLFSQQTYESVTTLQGREKLDSLATERVQKVLEEETGNSDIKKVYFTSFIIQ